MSPRAHLSRTVVCLGIASLLTDLGSEMIVPLMPLFLVNELGASKSFVGLVDGVADAVAAFFKLWSGFLSDRAKSRKRLILIGYGIASVVRPLMGFAKVPWHALAVRATDRVGKGLRTSPRDALLADQAHAGSAGRVFGFHRAMDNAGAIFGPLTAAALLALGFGPRAVFLWAVVPGALCLLVLLAIRETPRQAKSSEPSPKLSPAKLGGEAWTFLAIVFVFALSNSTDAFLLLRVQELGVSPGMVPILWGALHVVKSSGALLGGKLADRFPRPTLTAIGWAIYALAYVGLALATETWHAWALFLFYGLHFALCEPTERAMISDIVPRARLGQGFGLYHFALGAAAIPAGLLTGALSDRFGLAHALMVDAGIAGASAIALGVFARRYGRSGRKAAR